MKRLFFLIAFFFATAAPAFSQTNCSPFMGLSSAQFFGNDGSLLLNGALYSFAAGSTTPAPTFSDSLCTQVNVNPLTFGSGARATIFLNTSSFYKFILCQSNLDGPACSPSDVLYSVDGIQGGSSGGSGGTCSAGCTGFFISGTASPSTSGTLRMASSDSFGWRNQAGSSNLLLSKDVNDILTWQGGDEKYSEINCPATAPTGADLLCADVTAHRFKIAGNGGTMQQAVVAGADISNSDSITSVHFGASQAPFSATLPSSGQALSWNGSAIAGLTVTTEGVVTFNDNSTANCPSNGQTLSTLNACAVRWFWTNAHTITRFRIMLGTSAGCTTHPIYSVEDLTSSTVLTSLTQVNSTQTYDSGAISISTTAGHAFGIGMTTASSGCTTTPDFIQADMTYQ